MIARLLARLAALLCAALVTLVTLRVNVARLAASLHARFTPPARAWRRRLLARTAATLALLTLLAGPGSPLVSGANTVQAHAMTPTTGQWLRDPAIPNHATSSATIATPASPTPTPKAAKAAAKTSSPAATPQPILHNPGPMQPGALALSATNAASFKGSDGRFEVDVPAGAITPADVTAAGGGMSLRITQIAPGSGSSAGGSGRVSFGTYLIQIVDAQGVLLTQGLRKPVRIAYHVGSRDTALDLTKVYVFSNGPLPPAGVSVAPIALQPAPVSRRVPGLGETGIPVYPASVTATSIGLGTRGFQYATPDLKNHQLTMTTALATPSSTMAWDTDSPVAVFGSPDPFSADLSGGALTSSLPIDVPAGPGGLTPPVALTYSSASVSEQHNVQGPAGWVGEGWNLSLGSITWAEHNVTADCVATCGNTWEDNWQLADPFGTAAELIPPNINVSTYYDDTLNQYCGADGNANNATSYPCPIQWHTAPETRAKVFTYIGAFSLPDGPKVSCFRVFLPNGIMEEFGCTPDSLEYYYTPGSGNNTPGMGDYISAWNLDLITDPHGNQIHITYTQDKESKDFTVKGTDYGTHYYIRDAVLADIEWDSPGCHNAQTACAGSSWAPQMRVLFQSSHTPRLAGSPPSGCNIGTNLRCDDPMDDASGLPAPQVMSDFALNSIQTQVRASGTASWNTLNQYQLTYAESAPPIETDQITQEPEYTAGSFLLTQFQKLGASGTLTLPPATFTYQPNEQYYQDSAYGTTYCGPGWVQGKHGGGCILWQSSRLGNEYYLLTSDNGMGLHTQFFWADALNNTHGVNGGGANNANPLYCFTIGSAQSTYPCDRAADQNWTRTVLTKTDSSVGQAASSGNSTVTTETTYAYKLTYPVPEQECDGCVAGMYWGNQNDGDYFDYYNAKFMGFAEADVTQPDGSLHAHTFFATKGYGLYDGSVHCASSSPCHLSPWWDPLNALHGREKEVDTYDINGAPLSKTTTAYSVTCPPTGVSGTPASTAWGTWDGNLVSALDHNNPVAACEIHTTQTDQYTYNGAATPTHVSTAYYYNQLDTPGYLKGETITTTVNGGADGSPTTLVTANAFAWNDTVSATSTSATGTYILNAQTEHYLENSDDSARYGCVYTWVDGAFNVGATSGLVYGDVTKTEAHTDCGTPANSYTASGPLDTTTTYDSFGNPLTTTDPDANAGVSGHTGCVVGSVSATACTAYDATYSAVPTSQTNALGQTTTTAYASDVSGGFGLWPTSLTDANGQTTHYAYDELGRMTSQTLPGETSGDTTTSWSYTVWCATTGAQTPCVEIDQTQRVDSATTLTSRAFYDGWGHLIETRAPAPGGQDVVIYAQYDQAGRKTFQSAPYFVSAYTGAPGSTAFATPDTSGAQSGTSWIYADVHSGSLLTSSVKDALGHKTTTTAGVVCAPVSGDAGCYVTTTTSDPLGHQSVSYRDGLGRLTYSRAYTGSTSGTGGVYTLYATTSQGYDGAGRLASVLRPDGATLSFSYDDAGRQTASHDPDRGSETASYDPNGNITQTTDARGSSSGTIFAGYDGLNRQLWRNTTNSPTGAYVTYGYDATASAGGIGRLTSETFSNSNVGGSLSGSYAYSYDGRGQVTATTETVGGTPSTTSASYNDAGQLLSQTYPNDDTLATSYDPLSGWQQQERLTPNGGAAIPLLTAEAYNGAAGAMGLMTSASLGAFAALTSGSSGSYAASYDALGRLTSASATYTPAGGASGTLYSVQPTYDQLGNVIESVTTLPQGVDTQVFCYDDLARLTWAGSAGTPACSGAPTPSDTGSLSGTGGASYSASYSYDTLNRLTSSPLGSYTYGDAAHVDAATAIGSAWSASYDAAGNLTCRAATASTTCSGSSPTGAALSYDNEGQLATWANAQSSPTSSAQYLYDGEGQRVEQVATTSGVTTTTTYVGSLEEIATSGTTTTTTAYYGGLALSVNGALSYTLSDGLGSVSESVNATTGAVSATQLYAPYGAVRYQSGTLPGSRGYTGQHSDAATSGLDYYGARYYDPVAGQFTSADSTLAGGLNRYAYVGGNPESATDPTGHEERPDDEGVGGYVSGGNQPGGSGGGVATAPSPPTTTDTENDTLPSLPPDVPMGISGRTTLGLLIGLFVLGVAAVLYMGGQAMWQVWRQWTAHTSATGSVAASVTLNVGVWVAHGYGPTASSGGGGGGGGGTGTTPSIPPPTENGEAIGFGSPILSGDIVPECDPQLPLEALCIGYTRYYSGDYPGAYLAKAAPPYGPQNGIVDGVYINHRGIAEPWRAWYDPAGRIIARTDYTAGNRAAGIPPVHYHLFYWSAGAMPGQASQHFPGEFEPTEWPMWAPMSLPGE